jgi:hypothetical protein
MNAFELEASRLLGWYLTVDNRKFKHGVEPSPVLRCEEYMGMANEEEVRAWVQIVGLIKDHDRQRRELQEANTKMNAALTDVANRVCAYMPSFSDTQQTNANQEGIGY